MMLKSFLVLVSVLSVASAGFRCTFGNFACSASCVALGQTSGVCDGEGDCHCSERSISLSNLKALLPSRCNLGVSACEVTCHAIGRVGGTCKNNDCTCSDTFISPTEFALCGAASTCRLDCQRRGLASGDCNGWKCECVTNQNATQSVLELETAESG